MGDINRTGGRGIGSVFLLLGMQEEEKEDMDTEIAAFENLVTETVGRSVDCPIVTIVSKP